MRLVPRSDLATCESWEFFEKRCFTWLVEGPLSIGALRDTDSRVTRWVPCDTCRPLRGHNLDPFRPPRHAKDPAGGPLQRSPDRESAGARRQVDLAPGAHFGRAGGRPDQDFGPAGGR